MEKHTTLFGHFEVEATVSDEGDIGVSFYQGATRDFALSMSWDELREVIDFVAIHGLKMRDPYVVEFSDTRDAIEA